MNTEDYRIAPSGEGPHAATWKDKPHRLVYDLCRAIDNMRKAFTPFVDAGSLEATGDKDQLVRVTADEMSVACQTYLDAGGCEKLPAALQAKLEREQGLCTSVAHSQAENVARVRFILSAFESFLPLERAHRTFDDWQRVDDPPMNFEDYRYRLAR